MRHARPEDLKRLAPLLAQVRQLERLTEKTPGAFYCKGRAFLHFHEHDGALFADLRDGGDWRRFPASTGAEHKVLLAAVRAALA